MKRIFNSVIENEFFEEPQDSIFTVLLRELTDCDELAYLKKYSFIEGLLKYTTYTANTDLFQFVRPKQIKRMQKRKCFFVFDASTEGFSPIYDWPFFDALYYSCKKNNVHPQQIIFVSANLRDDENMRFYCKKNRCIPFNVFCFPSFEQVLAIDDHQKDKVINQHYNLSVSKCNKLFASKFLSSLSRTNRHFRSLSIFLLYNSHLKDNSLISHDIIEQTDPEMWLSQYGIKDIDLQNVSDWVENLPLVVDRDDFNINWAVDTPYRIIHDQTLFQIVNETHQKDWKKTSMFFSEKTFRPVAHFQPFVIYGQQGCNRWLSKIGYELYDDWFDLSFDEIEDPVLRCRTMIEMVSDTVTDLKKLARDDQIAWRFKNSEKLKRNFSTMINSKYSKSKLLKMLGKIK